MPFLLLLLLMLVFLLSKWPNPLGLDLRASAIWTTGALGVWCLLLDVITRLHRRALLREPGSRTQIMRRFVRHRSWLVHLLFIVFLCALFGFGWGAAIKEAKQESAIPALELAMLAPLFAGLFVGWFHFYDIDRTNTLILAYPELSPDFPGRWSYLSLHARHNLLLVVPPMFLVFLHETLFYFFPDLQGSRESLTVSLLGIGLLAAALVGMPLVLRIFLGLRSLAAGALRTRLEAAARRVRFRYADILIWDTRGGVANAMVTGVCPWLRYVVLTDKLIEDLDDDEIEAVFGHEVGHMKHHHMFFYMTFIMSSLMLLGGMWAACEQLAELEAVQAWLPTFNPLGQALFQSTDIVAVILVMAVTALYIVVVFGYLSRRCERQADLYGCKTTSPEIFIGALEKVAYLNGIPRERPGWLSSWQHSTIADRVNFIRSTIGDPTVEARFQRRLRALQWGLTMALAGMVVALRALWEWDLLKLM
jgi:Zn-dependent protease with chaperone function